MFYDTSHTETVWRCITCNNPRKRTRLRHNAGFGSVRHMPHWPLAHQRAYIRYVCHVRYARWYVLAHKRMDFVQWLLHRHWHKIRLLCNAAYDYYSRPLRPPPPMAARAPHRFALLPRGALLPIYVRKSNRTKHEQSFVFHWYKTRTQRSCFV